MNYFWTFKDDCISSVTPTKKLSTDKAKIMTLVISFVNEMAYR